MAKRTLHRRDTKTGTNSKLTPGGHALAALGPATEQVLVEAIARFHGLALFSDVIDHELKAVAKALEG